MRGQTALVPQAPGEGEDQLMPRETSEMTTVGEGEGGREREEG